MASILKHLRSSTADKRPTASGLADGQIAINTASGSPGIFFKDSNSNVVKVGPVHVGAAAPNASPVGSAGNSLGELWVDNSLTTPGLNYYTGSAFVNLTPSGTTSTVGLVELATNAETQTGSDAVRVVTPAGLQSKVSDSISTTSSTTIASATAAKTAYDLANAALPKSGGTVTGEILISPSGSIVFEGSSDDSFETTLAVVNPTADRTITLPNITGTVVTTGDTGSVTSTMIADGTIVNADINASAAIDPSKLGSGALPSGVTVSSTNIVDGTIVNADVNASAAIAGTKISPDFGGQNVVTTGSVTGASLIPSSATVPTNGVYLPAANTVGISTGGTGRLFFDSSGRVLINNTTARNIGSSVPSLFSSEIAQSGLLASFTRNSNDGTSAIVVLGKSRATAVGGTTIVQNNDTLGELRFAGADGVDLETNAAWIRGEVDGVPAADSIAGRIVFSTNSGTANTAPQERLRITSTGNVGIGTTSPTESLEVAGNAILDANNANLKIKSGTTGTTGAVNFTFNTDSSVFGSLSLPYDTRTSVGLKLSADAGGYPLTLASNSSHIIFENNSTERARIDSSGRLGIGTSAPQSLLHLRSDVSGAATQLYLMNRTSGASVESRIAFTTSANDLADNRHAYIGAVTTGAGANGNNFVIATNPNGGSAQTRVFVSSTGEVGIGTTSPGVLLHLQQSTGAEYLRFTANNATTDGDSTITLAAIKAGTAYHNFLYQASSHQFQIGGSERARIDSSGRLLVGTSTARANLFNSNISSGFQLEGAGITSFQRFLSVINNYATAGDGGGIVVLGRSKGGTVGSNTLIASEDQLGRIDFQGNDGTQFVTGASIEVWADNTTGADDMPSRIEFKTTADGDPSPSERMRIDSRGNVFFNSSTPTKTIWGTTNAVFQSGFIGSNGSFALDIVGNGYRNTSGAWTSLNQGGNIGRSQISLVPDATGGQIKLLADNLTTGTQPTERMRINGAGEVFFPGIGTTASAANAFLNSGTTPANQLLRSTSSLRYKTDVESIEEERSAAILNFRPVWYRSTAEADRSDWSWYGLIAEEVAPIEPRLVHWTYLDDAYEEIDGEKQLKPDAEMVPDGVQYDRLTVLLLDVVKRQQQAIESLEARLTAAGL